MGRRSSLTCLMIIDSGAEDDYGSGLRPSTFYKEICKVSYPDLDLKHLHVELVIKAQRYSACCSGTHI